MGLATRIEPSRCPKTTPPPTHPHTHTLSLSPQSRNPSSLHCPGRTVNPSSPLKHVVSRQLAVPHYFRVNVARDAPRTVRRLGSQGPPTSTVHGAPADDSLHIRHRRRHHDCLPGPGLHGRTLAPTRRSSRPEHVDRAKGPVRPRHRLRGRRIRRPHPPVYIRHISPPAHA